MAGRQQAGAKSPYELERTDLALAALARAVGIAAWQPRAAGAFRPGRDALDPGVGADHPALVAGSLQLQGFGTTDPQGVAITVGISLPLPIFDRNQGTVTRACRGAQGHARRAGDRRRARRGPGACRGGGAHAPDRRRAIRGRGDRAPAAGARDGRVVVPGRQGGLVELLDALDAITEARLRDLALIAAALDAELDARAAARGR